MHRLQILIIAILATAIFEFCIAAALTFSHGGGSFAQRLARAPMLDVLVALFTWIPWLTAVITGGWIGLAGTVVGQFIALYVWIFLHESMHREAARGPRIVR